MSLCIEIIQIRWKAVLCWIWFEVRPDVTVVAQAPFPHGCTVAVAVPSRLPICGKEPRCQSSNGSERTVSGEEARPIAWCAPAIGRQILGSRRSLSLRMQRSLPKSYFGLVSVPSGSDPIGRASCGIATTASLGRAARQTAYGVPAAEVSLRENHSGKGLILVADSLPSPRPCLMAH